ncbi:MAG: glycoside hydrolase family 2 protein, partial [Alloprevotella sp.]
MCATSLWGASPVVQSLHEGWKFKQVRLTNWYPATVPGVVHTDLLDNGIIEDPFFRLNERGLQWIDKEDWLYETRFTLDGEMREQQRVELVFEGLDTYADVYLNDSLVLKADNMFRRWCVEVKPLLKAVGENCLKVYFHSPVKVDVPKWDALPYHYPASNDQSENGGLLNKRISVFARKAGYHYGWDWGPRLVTSGIWRPVYLRGWSRSRICDLFMEQKQVDSRLARLSGHVELQADEELVGATLTVIDEASGKTLASRKVDVRQGVHTETIDFAIRNPRLWWTNGLGEPYRYTLRTELCHDGRLVDSRTLKVGVRSIRVVRDEDDRGRSFYFELNGTPLFAKGANYIPQDNFLPRVSPEQYRQTLLDAANVHMNMLRVWGGGIYEDDLFYDLCDEMGILVWQDFMFACSMYPAEGAWLESVRQEAIDNVKRLRNHACIALWCGNNECQDAWLGWGWKREVAAEGEAYAEKMWRQYVQQYHVTLPQVVEEYAPGTFYWPSSPFAAEGERSGSTHGDRHYWDVWHGKRPIADYNIDVSRFFSEYGFQSFPEFASVKRYAPHPQDWDIRSEVMMSHQRGGEHSNGLIETYLLNEYKKPHDFETFLYMGLVMQGDAIKTAIEAHRRMRPYNMGTLFWQHNDCWPVASWASRDYYGRWKAQHYFARKAYDDVLVSPIVEGDCLKVVLVSDRLKASSGQLSVKVCTWGGEEVFAC